MDGAGQAAHGITGESRIGAIVRLAHKCSHHDVCCLGPICELANIERGFRQTAAALIVHRSFIQGYSSTCLASCWLPAHPCYLTASLRSLMGQSRSGSRQLKRPADVAFGTPIHSNRDDISGICTSTSTSSNKTLIMSGKSSSGAELRRQLRTDGGEDANAAQRACDGQLKDPRCYESGAMEGRDTGPK